MADFHTNHHEERVIDRIRKDGFGFKEEEFPKYFVLRVALAWALNAPYLALESRDWERKKLDGDRGKEYHLEQITGKGKEREEDFDLLIRSMLYIKHKGELDRDKKDIFNDEKAYLKILNRYIQRGLYELDNTFKSTDCFYQWCLDNLHLSLKEQTKGHLTKNDWGYFSKIQHYFKTQGIDIRLMNEKDSYRHHICKIELLDSSKIQAFKSKSQYLDDELGQMVYMQQIKGVGRGYSLQIAKPKEKWQNLGLSELQQGLSYLDKQNYALGIFAGMDIEKEPFCFDLAKAVHLFVAGQTGSGKSVLLKCMLTCLLRYKDIEIIIIDPKQSSFKEFEKQECVKIYADSKDFAPCIEELITEMESRYTAHNQGQSYESMPYKILLIDELNDLVGQNKDMNHKLATLAQKARECKIHLILATQRPDAKTFAGGLRSNIPTRIALKVQKSTESKIILDEVGAEKLTGNGDMLIKLSDSSHLQRIIGIYLTEEEIHNQLKAAP